MKILLSAIAFHPSRGSESHVGWSAACLLAQHHHVWVLTHEDNREGVEEAFRQGIVPEQLRVVYLGQPYRWHPNRLLARLQSWREYHQWNRQLLPAALDLHRQIQFDLAHHLTYATWRTPPSIWRLPIPFVWGPVGGVARFPVHLLPHLSPPAAAFELVRNLANEVGRASPELRRCVRRAAAVIASNYETLEFIRTLRETSQGLHLLSAASFSQDQIRFFAGSSSESKPPGALQLFAGGNLIGSKGVIFALMALRILKAKGIPFHFTVASGGPEIPRLKQKTKAWGLSDSVTFNLGYQGEAYAQALRRSHVFLLPSFRENAPVTIMEAMLARCVPVVVKASAQGEIVNESCGFAVPVTNTQAIVEGLTHALVTLHRDRTLLEQLGTSAQSRIRTCYSRENYLQRILSIYAAVAQTKLTETR